MKEIVFVVSDDEAIDISSKDISYIVIQHTHYWPGEGVRHSEIKVILDRVQEIK